MQFKNPIPKTDKEIKRDRAITNIENNIEI